MATVHPRQLWLEKPLDRYTTPELQHLVLRWRSIRTGWVANQLTTPLCQQQHFLSEQSTPHISCVYLVEGGRWLLVGTQDGAIQYYDLNANNIFATTLIPSLFSGRRTDVRISVDMDASAESLTFHLATMLRVQEHDDLEYHHSTHVRWIQVWRITSDVDFDGRMVLKSEFKASFPEEYGSTCLSFRLRGQQVAYCLFYSDQAAGPFITGHQIIVVNWTICNTTSIYYTRKIVSTKGTVSNLCLTT